MEIALWILLGVFVIGILPVLVISYLIYRALLLRTRKEVWTRDPSMPDDEEYIRLYANATEWGRANAAFKKDVDVKNGRLRLCGEYFDFGGEDAVIIIPGRMEACTYSYHYAEPYHAAGFNVLCIDTRAHGKSDGRVNSIGFREYRDVIVWANYLRDTFGVKRVVLHGICIGASCALFTAAAKNCPDHIAGIAVDGMYQCFYDSCKNHMRYANRPVFPFIYGIMFWILVFSGANAIADGPKKRICRMHRPILFIHSREDLFSTPEKAQQLYDRCPSENKTLAWFDHGGHSRVRINNIEAYDKAVKAFIDSL